MFGGVGCGVIGWAEGGGGWVWVGDGDGGGLFSELLNGFVGV